MLTYNVKCSGKSEQGIKRATPSLGDIQSAGIIAIEKKRSYWHWQFLIFTGVLIQLRTTVERVTSVPE